MSSRRSFRLKPSFVAPLSLYEKPPEDDISIEDFQTLAIDRLRVLRSIEEGRLARRHPDQIYENATGAFNEAFSDYDSKEAAHADLCSHFILRLAFCQNEEFRNWLILHECELFSMRFQHLSDNDKATFLRVNHLPFQDVTKSERKNIKTKLSDVFLSTFEFDKSKAVNAEDYTIFFKVPFEEVPQLIGSRRVYIQKGFAYVPRDEILSLIVTQFKTNLVDDLKRLCSIWTSEIVTTEADRLVPILQSLKSTYTGPDFAKSVSDGEAVSKEQLLELSKTRFPLCMKHAVDKLLQEHHLKHHGRQQLTLFLKGIGLSLADALQFWKEAFNPRTNAERFEKEYAYNVRHNYGKEGKRANYTPFSCMKIISSSPGVGEHHGCPFKTLTESQLNQSLVDMQVPMDARNQILTKARSQLYQVACGMVWEARNGLPLSTGVHHPNQYFNESAPQ